MVKSDELYENEVSLDELIDRICKMMNDDWHLLYLDYPKRWLTLDTYEDPFVIMNAVRPIYTRAMLFTIKHLSHTMRVLEAEKEIICDDFKGDGDMFKTQYTGYYGYKFSALTTIPTYFKSH